MEENDDVFGDRFMYPPQRSLKKMASHEVALSVWNNYLCSNSDSNFSKDSRKLSSNLLISDDTYEEDNDKTIENLELPRSIECEIKNALRDIYDEIKSWVARFECSNTLFNLSKFVSKHRDLNNIVWFSHGFIHYEFSARNILATASEQNPEVIFSIMSEFCLEDEIVKFDPHSLPEPYVQIATTRTVDDSLKYPLLNYWVRYLKKELHLSNFRSPATVKKYYGKKWTAFKYFWHLFDSNERELLVELLFSSGDRDECYEKTYLYRYYNKERLFFMLSSQQQYSLLSRLSHRIIFDFSRRPNFTHKESALWAWRQSKEFMSLEEFSYLVKFLLSQFICFESVFIEIWKTAPDHFRHFLLNSELHERLIIPKCLLNYKLHHHDRYTLSPPLREFFIEFLSSKSADSRKRLITGRDTELCYIKDLSFLQELLDLCYPDINDQMELKTKVTDSYEMRRTCNLLLGKYMDFDKLKTTLQFYFADQSAAQEFISRLMNYIVDYNLHFIYNVEHWNKFSSFIDEISQNDATVSLEMKKRFISNVVCNGYDFDDFETDCQLAEMIQILETVFDNEELKAIESSFLWAIRKRYVFRNKFLTFNADLLIGILSWCFRNSDEKTIQEFKMHQLPIDVLFDGILHFLMDVRNDKNFKFEKCFLELDKCLSWYIASGEERKKYKLMRINDINNFYTFDVLKTEKRSNLEFFLKWFFDNDEKAITKFKLSNKLDELIPLNNNRAGEKMCICVLC